jgi:hypothetical protein
MREVDQLLEDAALVEEVYRSLITLPPLISSDAASM